MQRPDLKTPDDPSDRKTTEASGEMSPADEFKGAEEECESDYLTAFLLDAERATREMVRALEGDIREDVEHVLTKCRKRLKTDAQDLLARTRLGLTLLLINQDAEAYCELQQVFLQSPTWRPFLRLLVSEAKRRRWGTPAHSPHID